MKYYQVEQVSEIGNSNKYLRLFRITGVTGRLTMLIITGHNNIYANESLDINSDINVFQCSGYASKGELKMTKNMEWKMIWSNIRLAGEEVRVVIGYEEKDGEREYGIYLTRLCSCKIFLHEEYLGYESQHNYYFDSKEIESSNVTIINKESYQDDFKSTVTPFCAVSGINPLTVSREGNILIEYSLYLYNTDHFNVSFLKDVGYVSSIKDSNDNDIKYDGKKGGYQIKGSKMPIKLQLYATGRKINQIYDNYYFGIIVDSKYIKIVQIPLSNTVSISSLEDIDSYNRKNGVYIIGTMSPRAFYLAGYNKNVKKLLPFGVHNCPTKDRPTDSIIGECILDTSLNKIIWWNGNCWIDANGNPADAKKQGTTEERPTAINIGFIYKDTTLNKLIIWNGSAWVNMDGTELEVSTSHE